MIPKEMPDARRRGLCLAGVGATTAAVLAGLPGIARAAECPPDQVRTAGAIEGPTAPVGVSDALLASIDLAHEKVRLPHHQLRLRRLVVQPGGVVPVHSHANRPALIYIVEGEVTEYKNICAAPITHKAGEATPEIHAVVHWWRNNGRAPAVILAADLFQAGEHPTMM